MQGPQTKAHSSVWTDKHKSSFSFIHPCDSLWETSNMNAPEMCFSDCRETFISPVDQ